MLFLSPQIIISCVKDVRGGVSGDTGKSNTTIEPSDGKRHSLVSAALGQNLPTSGRETVWAGETGFTELNYFDV